MKGVKKLTSWSFRWIASWATPSQPAASSRLVNEPSGLRWRDEHSQRPVDWSEREPLVLTHIRRALEEKTSLSQIPFVMRHEFYFYRMSWKQFEVAFTHLAYMMALDNWKKKSAFHSSHTSAILNHRQQMDRWSGWRFFWWKPKPRTLIRGPCDRLRLLHLRYHAPYTINKTKIYYTLTFVVILAVSAASQLLDGFAVVITSHHQL